MDRYEYKEVQLPPGMAVTDFLNEQGKEGWQALHFYHFGVSAIVLFKRKIKGD